MTQELEISRIPFLSLTKEKCVIRKLDNENSRRVRWAKASKEVVRDRFIRHSGEAFYY